MSNDVLGTESEADLRRRALERLPRPTGAHDRGRDASAALAVLHKLASSASSAEDALALLHELQVHQVELELQDEELRRSRAELEATLFRQVQLYDFAPVGCFSVDRNTQLREVNLTAAGMLGGERAQLLGHNLDAYLAPQGARALHAMLTRLGDGAPSAVGTLQLAAARGPARSVHASANRDPDGRHFLVAFVDAAEGAEQSSV
jgi:PAS domain-containing protein